MGLAANISALEWWEGELSALGLRLLGGTGNTTPIYIVDLIMIGALKRTVNLRSAFAPMIEAKNMLVARALLRMHLDTVSRLLAYTYVSKPDDVASAVIGGTQLRKFKSRDGQPLTDAYLVQRLSQDHPWVKTVYESTSGYVHFSERQFLDSISSVDEGKEGAFNLCIGKTDDTYPESSWSEVVACFNHLTRLLADTMDAHASTKPANSSSQRTATAAAEPKR